MSSTLMVPSVSHKMPRLLEYATAPHSNQVPGREQLRLHGQHKNGSPSPNPLMPLLRYLSRLEWKAQHQQKSEQSTVGKEENK